MPSGRHRETEVLLAPNRYHRGVNRPQAKREQPSYPDNSVYKSQRYIHRTLTLGKTADRALRSELGKLITLFLVAGCLLLVVSLALAISRSSAPRIDTEFGGAAVKISADRSWVLLPGHCATLTWDLEGIQSLYINGEGNVGRGEMEYCPTFVEPSLEIDITTLDGTERRFTLEFRYVLCVLLFMTGLVGMTFAGLTALDGVLNRAIGKLLLLRGTTLCVLTLLLTYELIKLSVNPALLEDFMLTLRSLFTSPEWQIFGIILAGLIYVPLIVGALQRELRSKRSTDLIVLGSFLLFVFFLYLPFGFDSIGHWETWNFNAWWEGSNVWFLESELIYRFWVIVPHTLAKLISSDSYGGYHLLNFLMFWGKLALLYGILRQLGVKRLYAYLITMLFMVYPVNSALMSMRSLPMQFSMIALLAAVYFMLEYKKSPSLPRLLAIWLGLLFNVGSNESAYVIILVVPLLWWLRDRQLSWRNFKLTAIWYVFPALKAVNLLLLLSMNQFFYRSALIEEYQEQVDGLNIFQIVIQKAANVYLHTFLDAWQDAFTAMGKNTFLGLALAMVLLVGSLAWFLAPKFHPPPPQQLGFALLSGMAFIFPSIGILVLFDIYYDDLWRLYFYVPIGAAIATFSLIALLTATIRNIRRRNIIIIVLTVILMFPATSRLLLQHEYFVKSANSKAWILRQVIEQTPAIDNGTHLGFLTDMSRKELYEKKIYGLHLSYTWYSMFYILYQDGHPSFVSLCNTDLEITCLISGDELVEKIPDEDYVFQNLILYRLHEDLTVELLDELPAEFNFAVHGGYYPHRLYNPDAPIPPRAITMLAADRRD